MVAGQVIRVAFYISATTAHPYQSSGAGWYIDDVSLPTSRFRDLGGSTESMVGRPCLELCGPLTSGSTIELNLSAAADSQCMFLFISLSSTPVSPFLGGTLHSFPFSELLLVHTDATGSYQASGPFPSLPSGTELWFQAAVTDPTMQPFGHTLSNGVVGTVP